ncbi:MAG: endo alpha-1,4 polygalactosaminidase [Hyphomicrobiaceae bacterium]|nr:endo alpha-1,4 polygalactosaminidase [Hyphomicrobiaceae bacterium]
MLTRRALLGTGMFSMLGHTLPVWATTPKKPPPQAGAAPGRHTARELIRNARSWTYQLQGFDLGVLVASPADILVLDESITGTSTGNSAAKILRKLQKKPDGSRRLVLAYMSIGEAEEYRSYWKPEWIETAAPEESEPDKTAENATTGKPGTHTAEAGEDTKHADARQVPHASGPGGKAPADATEPEPRPDRWPSSAAPPWLGDENESWSGNFAVRYEHPDWQAIFLEGDKSYLARLIAEGFDGVYLDRVDAFDDHTGDSNDPQAEMVAFVRRIAETAHRLKPDFLIVPQNGEELLLRDGYVDLIDAIAKEDLLFGSPSEGKANSNAQIANSIGWLSVARRHGRPVLVVEYLNDPKTIEETRSQLQQLGYVVTFAPRMLDSLSEYAVSPSP